MNPRGFASRPRGQADPPGENQIQSHPAKRLGAVMAAEACYARMAYCVSYTSTRATPVAPLALETSTE